MANTYATAHLPSQAANSGDILVESMATTTPNKKQKVASPAANAVYNTTELLERILGQLPAKKLLQFSLVNRRVYAIVHRSPEALHNLIFTGIDNISRSGLPKLNPALPAIRKPTQGPKRFIDNGCEACILKRDWSNHNWITEIMCHRFRVTRNHHVRGESLWWWRRLLELESSYERQRLPVWHVRLDVVWRLLNRETSWWKGVWLRADKGPVEVHVLGAGFRCYYARTVAEVVAWGSPTYKNVYTDEVMKWRLEMFGTPEEVIAELGLKDVVAYNGTGPIPVVE